MPAPHKHLPSPDPTLANFAVMAEEQLEIAECGLLKSRGQDAKGLEPVRKALRRLAHDAQALRLTRIFRTARAAVRLIDELADRQVRVTLNHEDLLLDAVDDLREALSHPDHLDGDREDSSAALNITRRIANLGLPPKVPASGK